MADCTDPSFTTSLSNGAKATLLGLIFGGALAAFRGIKKDRPPPPPPSAAKKKKGK